MAISIKRYVDITSGVGAAANIAQRDLIGLLFTSSKNIDYKTVLEMTNSADVADFFGVDSEEAKRATFYFNFISKNITKPKKIKFARYGYEGNAPLIIGDTQTTQKDVDTWCRIVNGNLKLRISSVSHQETADLKNLNFSEVTTLSDVADQIQTKLRTIGSLFSSCEVTYEGINSRFEFNGGIIGQFDLDILQAEHQDLNAFLGWQSNKTIVAGGMDAETPLDAFNRITLNITNNFGSFAFINDISLDQIIEVAKANSEKNVEYIYSIPLKHACEAPTYYASLSGISGACVTYAPKDNEYDEIAPMMVLAATDYTKRNSTQNYMFQSFDLVKKINNASDADIMDKNRINYIGVTQTAGQNLKFYQRGVMMGGTTVPVDLNTYANEMWLKDASLSQLMTLLLTSPKVSANAEGRAQVIAILQDVINRALFNGTISVDKPLSKIQKLYISQMSGDDGAWRQVQSIGYWLDCKILSQATSDNRTEWKAEYCLIYAKDDVVRKIEGTHTLI